MRTESLREFAAIARHKSFNAAAKELFIARSALSSHISALEKELGFALFDRAGGVELTLEGSIFLAHVTPMLDDLEKVIEQLRGSMRDDESHDSESNIRVSYAGADVTTVSFLRKLTPRHISLMTYNPSKTIIANIEASEPDAMFFFDVRRSEILKHEFSDRGMRFMSMGKHPYALITANDNPLTPNASHTCANELGDSEILLCGQPEFELLQDLLRELLGENVNFSLLADSNPESLQNLDLKGRFLLSMSPALDKSFSGDDRVRVITHLDDRLLEFDQIVIVKEHPRNKDVANFYDSLASVAADGSWDGVLHRTSGHGEE